MAFESQGTEFFWSATTAATTAAARLVGDVTDFSGPGGQASVIDITNLNSTAKEKLVGLRDEGQVSLSLNMAFGHALPDCSVEKIWNSRVYIRQLQPLPSDAAFAKLPMGN